MKLTFFRKNKWILMIVFMGFFLRVFQVAQMPPALNWDEVSHGYNAYSILKTGKDEWGISFPTIFRAFGDYKLPVYIYLTVLSELVFGLSAFAVRFPSVIAGTVSVLFTYLLARKVFEKNDIALLAALIMALSPWNFFLSRIAVEANVALALIISGVYFCINSLSKKNIHLFFGLLLLSLSVWTYNSARIFVPLFILAFLILNREKLRSLLSKKKLLAALCTLVLGIFIIPMFVQLLNPEGSARYENVQILDVGAIAEINDRRQQANLSPLVERMIYNKATFFIEKFVPNYVAHFSPSFLFLYGGDNYQFNVPGYGLFHLINLPLLVYGSYKIVRNKKSQEIKTVIAWLLVSPIAASLTRESPHTLRSIMLITPLVLFISYGFWELKAKLKIANLLRYYIILLLASTVMYSWFYWGNYKRVHSFAWQYGYEQAAKIISEKYDEYEKIVMTKRYAEPHEFLLFYLKVDPEKYRNDPNLIRFSKSEWFWVDRFDKFYFVNDWEVPDTSSRFTLESGEEFDCAKCLLFTSKDNAPENWSKIDEILFLNGDIAFEIYEH